MATPLKDLYSPTYFEHLSESLKAVLPTFDKARFLQKIYDTEWENRELKQRMYHIRTVLAHFLADDFEKAAQQLLALVEHLRAGPLEKAALEAMYIPDYIENNGLDAPDLAAAVFEQITSYTSCEFAIRPFILKDPHWWVSTMLEWSKHPDEHIRRLASEGCRPRLPWAIALANFKKDPTPILPILENLKADPSEYVRRSVANNLNDISKDNPSIALSVFERWMGHHPDTDRLVKHGSRTLLKKGHPEALALFGLGSTEGLSVTDFSLSTQVVSVGEYLPYAFTLTNDRKEAAQIRLECGVYYLKANGTHSRKVFKIAEREIAAQTTERIERRQHFKPITTRVYHPGTHALAIIVNGEEMAKMTFELLL